MQNIDVIKQHNVEIDILCNLVPPTASERNTICCKCKSEVQKKFVIRNVGATNKTNDIIPVLFVGNLYVEVHRGETPFTL